MMGPRDRDTHPTVLKVSVIRKVTITEEPQSYCGEKDKPVNFKRHKGVSVFHMF